MDKQGEKTTWVPGVTSAMVGLIAACTVCCAPLITTMIAGMLAALGLEAYLHILISWQGLTLMPLAGGSIGIVFWRLKSRSRRCAPDRPARQCASKCDT